MVFSRNGKKLYYYPVARKGKYYRVPDSVKRIDDNAFYGNQNLRSVYTGKNNDLLSAEILSGKGYPVDC